MAIDPVVGGALIGAGSSLAGSGINTVVGLLGRRRQWEREDNAVQRRAADLEAAGLSKTLAAGSAASSQTVPVSTGSGFSDAGKHLGQIPMAKAQKAAIEANTDKTEQDVLSAQYANIEAGNRQRWLDSPARNSPVWPAGTSMAGQPMFTNREQQQMNWEAEQDAQTNTMGFYNDLNLPNQPGVLQSQVGQVLILNQAWSKMNPQERKQFLLAYGAKSLADLANNFMGSAAGSLGTNLKAPSQSTITHIKGGGN